MVGYTFKQFISSLMSRKFLLLLGTGIILAVNQQWTELVVAVLAYCGINVTEQKINSEK